MAFYTNPGAAITKVFMSRTRGPRRKSTWSYLRSCGATAYRTQNCAPSASRSAPGAVTQFIQHHPDLVTFIDHLVGAQSAADVFCRVQQPSAVNGELVLVQRTLDDAVIDTGR